MPLCLMHCVFLPNTTFYQCHKCANTMEITTVSHRRGPYKTTSSTFYTRQPTASISAAGVSGSDQFVTSKSLWSNTKSMCLSRILLSLLLDLRSLRSCSESFQAPSRQSRLCRPKSTCHSSSCCCCCCRCRGSGRRSTSCNWIRRMSRFDGNPDPATVPQCWKDQVSKAGWYRALQSMDHMTMGVRVEEIFRFSKTTGGPDRPTPSLRTSTNLVTLL